MVAHEAVALLLFSSDEPSYPLCPCPYDVVESPPSLVRISACDTAVFPWLAPIVAPGSDRERKAEILSFPWVIHLTCMVSGEPLNMVINERPAGLNQGTPKHPVVGGLCRNQTPLLFRNSKISQVSKSNLRGSSWVPPRGLFRYVFACPLLISCSQLLFATHTLLKQQGPLRYALND